MRKYMMILILCCYCGSPASFLEASQQDTPADTQAVIDRANDLNELLDRLLDPANHSSIQRSITSNGVPFITFCLILALSSPKQFA